MLSVTEGGLFAEYTVLVLFCKGVCCGEAGELGWVFGFIWFGLLLYGWPG